MNINKFIIYIMGSKSKEKSSINQKYNIKPIKNFEFKQDQILSLWQNPYYSDILLNYFLFDNS